MSVTACNEIEREGSWSLGSREYSRLFRVETDAAADGESTVLATTGLPLLLDLHPSDDMQYCSKKTAKLESRDASQCVWLVTCAYTFSVLGTGADAPWDLPAMVSVGTSKYTRPLTYAYDRRVVGAAWRHGPPYTQGDPVMALANVNGMPFDPTVEQEENCVLLEISFSKTDDDIDPTEYANYRNTVNSEDVTICGFVIKEFCGRVADIKMDRKWWTDESDPDADPLAYWDLVFSIEIRPETHLRRLMNRGMDEYVGAGAFPTAWFPTASDLGRIHDKEGEDVAEPQMLSLEGVPLAADVPPIYFDFLTYFPIKFSVLGLPEEMPTPTPL